jgi:predicted DNA-binding protein (UPF0251 family)
MDIKSRIAHILNRLNGRHYAVTPNVHPKESFVTPISQPLPKPRARKPNAKPQPPASAEFNLSEALRMRSEGMSNRKIARHMPFSRETVRKYLQIHDAQVTTATPPPAPVEGPPAATLHTATPAAQFVPPPIVSQFVPPAPVGLDTIPEGCTSFFLVMGAQNQQYAKGYAQPCIGIEQWHREYARLPVFRDAERVWVVVNLSEDNQAFVMSLAADIWVRERCVISTQGVQHVAKARLLMQRRLQRPWFAYDAPEFEAVHRFQPLAQAKNVREIAELLAKPETDADAPMLGGSPNIW